MEEVNSTSMLGSLLWWAKQQKQRRTAEEARKDEEIERKIQEELAEAEEKIRRKYGR